MASTLRLEDLKKRIDWAAHKARLACAHGGTPVDLEMVCAQLGVNVEWRNMVPEGVTTFEPHRVSIFLQANFKDDPRLKRRQRFTFAHEICHALFHEGHRDRPRPLAGIPKGASLEKLCQQGAGYLLAPTDLLPTSAMVSRVQDFERLSTRFDVSMDVLIRRVHEVNRLLPQEYAILLVRGHGEILQIDAMAFASLPDNRLRLPQIGDDFTTWLAPLTEDATQLSPVLWAKSAGPERFEIRRDVRSAHSELVEIQAVI